VNRATAWGVSLATGGAVASGVYRFGSPDLALAAAVAASYTAVVRLTLVHPDTAYESNVPVLAVGRWSGLSTGFLLAVVVFGVAPTLPLDNDLRLGLRVLVLGAGYAMWLFGVSYAREKNDDPEAQHSR